MIILSYLAGWWLSPTPLKNMKVSWDDEIPNIYIYISLSLYLGKLLYFTNLNSSAILG